MVRYLILLCVLFVVACGGPAAQQSATQTVFVAAGPTATIEAPSATVEPSATTEPSATAMPTDTQGPTATAVATTTVVPPSVPQPTTTTGSSLGGAMAKPTASTMVPSATRASTLGGAMAKPTATPPEPTTVPVQPLPTPTSASAAPTAAEVPAASEGQRFRAVSTPDGIVAVREDPNTTSPIVRSLTAGAEVTCTGVTDGESLQYNGQRSSRWYFCPGVGGFIFELLLEPVRAAEAPAPLSPTSPPVVAYVDSDYRVVLTPDGFVAVRAQPTTQSATIRTLTAGTIIRCTEIVKGELLTYLELSTNQWLSCPSVGGYVFAPLLVTTFDTPAVVEPYVVP